ncbi:MAG: D-glycero-alpha-D-manno-heptose 7-phosphate kinase [Syntrophus sp. PtaU1.Bin208]|nr:MAG: D-glycero-alpha-D-manno-heptose 7-phosphate kinase [Syntrophus sp. PtaU1.Bin208]
MMIIVRTPFRISFFGGGTDYPAWYEKNGGAVLATTINKYCYLTCRYLPPFFEHRIRVVYSKMESCQTVDEIQHPSVREVLRYLKMDRGVEIHHDGDLPARSGIGSSSSFTVGLLHAIYALKGKLVDKETLARESIYIERDVLRETVGSQDQILAAYGGLNHITFGPGDVTAVKPLTLSRTRREELNSHLMLFYSGIKRTASRVAETYVNGIDRKQAHFLRMMRFVEEGMGILGSGDVRDFGRLLHEAWLVKRDLSPEVTNPDVDELYTEARAAGALGGKLLGAGGGGFILFFAPPERQQEIKDRLHRLIYVPFQFDYHGSQIIFHDPREDYSELDRYRRQNHIEPFRELDQVKVREKR